VRYVIDCDTLLRIAAGEIEVAPEHKLLAPTIVRSQALATLYAAAGNGEITREEGLERVWTLNAMKVRFLGDRALQSQAWKVAEKLGWETTETAEFVALTQLQGDALATSDKKLAKAIAGHVEGVAPAALGR
jgi:predicted nucleic acid-binding protein